MANGKLTLLSQILLIQCIPLLRDRLFPYGPRARSPMDSQRPSLIGSLIDRVAALQVPHSWFASFYVLSVSLSLFWPFQIYGPSLFRRIASGVDLERPTMTLDQLMVTWLMMFLQGSRRLYESLVISKPSSAQMWIGHWAMGIMFYALTSVALWIEGTRTCTWTLLVSSLVADRDTQQVSST